MINNLEVIIGIEVHVVLNTKTKMFSFAKNSHNGLPNTLVNEIDLGTPGTLPQVNKQAIVKGIWLAKSIEATTNYKNIQFDRKNYYYLDLPKGFQITQQYYPLGVNGKITINTPNGPKDILIQRMHLEEDTAKQIAKNDVLLLDYNRCGAPLIEIVTEPVISSANEAMEYLKKLIQILKFNNISDAKLEDGSLRADINISLRPYGQPTFNNKVEIKNINSINNVAKAINYEISRQTELYLSGTIVNQETRRFDDTTNTTVFMRTKMDATNYRYIHEYNIPIITMSDDDYQNIINDKPKDINEVTIELTNFGLSTNNIELLLNDYELYKVYLELVKLCKLPLLAFNWLTVELIGLLNKEGQSIINLPKAKLKALADMLVLLDAQDINGKQAKVILDAILKTEQTVLEIIKNNGFEQIKDVSFLTNMIQNHITNNPEIVQQYSDRPERVEKFLVGLVMRDTKSQANPKITMDIIVKLLDKNK